MDITFGLAWRWDLNLLTCCPWSPRFCIYGPKRGKNFDVFFFKIFCQKVRNGLIWYYAWSILGTWRIKFLEGKWSRWLTCSSLLHKNTFSETFINMNIHVFPNWIKITLAFHSTVTGTEGAVCSGERRGPWASCWHEDHVQKIGHCNIVLKYV